MECQEAFDESKQKFCSEPMFRLPNFSLPSILTTDWSKLPLGAVLPQIDSNIGFDHPIAFKFRLLSSMIGITPRQK